MIDRDHLNTFIDESNAPSSIHRESLFTPECVVGSLTGANACGSFWVVHGAYIADHQFMTKSFFVRGEYKMLLFFLGYACIKAIVLLAHLYLYLYILHLYM
ncbi:hypothetical protein LguiA_009407 [Lonicera macranthoides]